MLKNKIALVTGSTSGIGLAIAKAFVKEGATVVMNGFGDMHHIANIVADFNAMGPGKAIHCAADLLELEDIEQLVQFTKDTFHGLDILVNNAGVQHISPIDRFPVDKWNHIINLNLNAVFHMTRLCLPLMREREWGRIINISSTHGIIASPGKAAYVAAKHGVIGLTKVTALETAKENITCNAICPGFVLTPLVEGQIRERSEEQGLPFEEVKHTFVQQKHPSGEFVAAESVAAMAVFLCSEAASQIKGASYVMDGGWTVT